jgi:phosphatidylinositol glycan class V
MCLHLVPVHAFKKHAVLSRLHICTFSRSPRGPANSAVASPISFDVCYGSFFTPLPLLLTLINLRLADLPLSTSKILSVTYHGIIVANVSHLISVLVLHRLAFRLPLGKKSIQSQFAFVAAALHVISPAGLFLTAPYAESLFSLLNLLGQLLYVLSWAENESGTHTIIHDIYLISSGLCFGIAATVRGNGLLSGIIFALDALIWFGISFQRMTNIPILNLAILPPQLQKQIKSFQSRRLPATVVAGLLVGIGFTVPQYIAYREYCNQGLKDRQPWCSRFPPSIYSWVQNHYW